MGELSRIGSRPVPAEVHSRWKKGRESGLRCLLEFAVEKGTEAHNLDYPRQSHQTWHALFNIRDIPRIEEPVPNPPQPPVRDHVRGFQLHDMRLQV